MTVNWKPGRLISVERRERLHCKHFFIVLIVICFFGVEGDLIFTDDEEDPNNHAPSDFEITDQDINDRTPEDHDAGLNERWREVIEIAKRQSPDLKVKK